MTTANRATSRTRRLLAAELGIWRSLLFLLARRVPGRRSGTETFGYSRDVTPLLLAFIMLSALELPVVGLLLPWALVRFIVLILSVWGLLWMIGFLASMRVHPHLVDHDGVRVRRGANSDIRIPYPAIAGVAARKERYSNAERVHVDKNDDGEILNVTVSKQTNASITLQQPTAIRLGDEMHQLSEVRLYADDASALVRAIRSRLERPDPGRSKYRTPMVELP